MEESKRCSHSHFFFPNRACVEWKSTRNCQPPAEVVDNPKNQPKWEGYFTDQCPACQKDAIDKEIAEQAAKKAEHEKKTQKAGGSGNDFVPDPHAYTGYDSDNPAYTVGPGAHYEPSYTLEGTDK